MRHQDLGLHRRWHTHTHCGTGSRLVHIKTFAHDIYVVCTYVHIYIYAYVSIYIYIIHTHTDVQVPFWQIIYVVFSAYCFERLFLLQSQEMRRWYHGLAQPHWNLGWLYPCILGCESIIRCAPRSDIWWPKAQDGSWRKAGKNAWRPTVEKDPISATWIDNPWIKKRI